MPVSPKRQSPVGTLASDRPFILPAGPVSLDISGFLQQTLLGSKTQQPILDLSSLKKYLKSETFKMKTPESIRISLQKDKWVVSIGFKNASFHIPINRQSRKYLRFYVQGQSYQFKVLLFGLSTASMKFTVVVKEVRLLAQNKGIRIHQYLEDWWVRDTSHQACLKHIQILVALGQELGWVVNLEKSKLEPKQIFDFVGYQYDSTEGKVRPTLDN